VTGTIFIRAVQINKTLMIKKV